MSTVEWFRRSTWTDVDRSEFNAKLNRSRKWSRAQYLRIQAVHLAMADQHDGVLELLDRMFAEYPEDIHLAQAHAQKANSLAILGRTDAAINEYRAGLQAERDFPNVGTQAWLDFGMFVVEKRLTEYYGEITNVMKEFRDEGELKFPASEYRYFVIQSFLAEARGEKIAARDFAKQALAEAAKDHSGLRYHPTIDLVRAEDRIRFEQKLKTLAKG